MSDTDSFISEVTEEVRRDRLYALARRYGWIGVLLVALIVGGTAWQAWQRNAQQERAQQFGDGVLGALATQDAGARVDALAQIDADDAASAAVRDFLVAASQREAGDIEGSLASLAKIEGNSELAEIYRQIAAFKALALSEGITPDDARRAGFEQLATPGNPLRLLAEEQIALIDYAAGNGAAALERLQAVMSDSEATPDLQQRAAQVIVALGGEPDFGALLRQ